MEQNVYQTDTRSEYEPAGTRSLAAWFTQFSSILTQSTNITDLTGSLTLIMNEVFIFEKSWGAERRGKDKIGAMANYLLRGSGVVFWGFSISSFGKLKMREGTSYVGEYT